MSPLGIEERGIKKLGKNGVKEFKKNVLALRDEV